MLTVTRLGGKTTVFKVFDGGILVITLGEAFSSAFTQTRRVPKFPEDIVNTFVKSADLKCSSAVKMEKFFAPTLYQDQSFEILLDLSVFHFNFRGRLYPDCCERRKQPASIQDSGWTCGAHQARSYFSEALPIMPCVVWLEWCSLFRNVTIMGHLLQIAVDCIEVIFIRGRSLMYFKVLLVGGIPTGIITVTTGQLFSTCPAFGNKSLREFIQCWNWGFIVSCCFACDLWSWSQIVINSVLRIISYKFQMETALCWLW